MPFDNLSAATHSPFAAPDPTWSFDQIVANFLRWNARWSEAPIQYSFYTARPAHQSGEPAYDGFRAFTAAQQDATRLAFELISEVANLTFVQVADNQQPVGPNNQRITFAASTTFPAFATAWADPSISTDLALPGRHQIYSSETLFNTNRWGGSFAPGTRDFSVLMHEILHGLGMPHPGQYNRNANEDITYAAHAEYAQDTGQYSVMSYFGAHETGAEHLGRFGSTLLLHDMAAMQALYGANMTTRTGDTVYGFGSNAGRAAYDFAVNALPVVCIWDAGGDDTLDCSGFGTNQVLNLIPGLFSNVGALTGNVVIAFGAEIENAIGGSGADIVYGNAQDNRLEGRQGADQIWGLIGDDILFGGDGDDRLTGGQGSDYLDGGLGEDTAIFSGAFADYSILRDGGGFIVKGTDGGDILFGVEYARFDDRVVHLDQIICRDPTFTEAGPKGELAPVQPDPFDTFDAFVQPELGGSGAKAVMDWLI